MPVQHVAARPMEWVAETIIASENYSLPARALARVTYFAACEALAVVATAYHALALGAKTLPAATKLVLTHIPIVKVQHLGDKIPEWANASRLIDDHLLPIKDCAVCGLAAPFQAILVFSNGALGLELKSSIALAAGIAQKTIPIKPSDTPSLAARVVVTVLVVASLALSCEVLYRGLQFHRRDPFGRFPSANPMVNRARDCCDGMGGLFTDTSFIDGKVRCGGVSPAPFAECMATGVIPEGPKGPFGTRFGSRGADPFEDFFGGRGGDPFADYLRETENAAKRARDCCVGLQGTYHYGVDACELPVGNAGKGQECIATGIIPEMPKPIPLEAAAPLPTNVCPVIHEQAAYLGEKCAPLNVPEGATGNPLLVKAEQDWKDSLWKRMFGYEIFATDEIDPAKVIPLTETPGQQDCATIRKWYKKTSLLVHPDRLPNNDAVKAACAPFFDCVNSAWDQVRKHCAVKGG